ncbi:unnamed protein product [Coregonus sp. 'balchen']|nr:unnamed protein product [Coregonus sp. 'balchen']
MSKCYCSLPHPSDCTECLPPLQSSAPVFSIKSSSLSSSGSRTAKLTDNHIPLGTDQEEELRTLARNTSLETTQECIGGNNEVHLVRGEYLVRGQTREKRVRQDKKETLELMARLEPREKQGNQDPKRKRGAAINCSGTPGLPGLQIPKVDKGHIGLPGIPGQNGIKGDTGAQGSDGVQGAPGLKGYTGPTGQPGPIGPEGIGRIWFDDLQCTGREASVFDCPHNGMGINNCQHNEDTGVQCV